MKLFKIFKGFFMTREEKELRRKIKFALGIIKCNDVERGFNRKYGICYNVFNISNVEPLSELLQVSEILQDLFKVWPSLSGNLRYPIAIIDKDSAYNEYDLARRNKTLWIGDYGYKRQQLAEWLYENIESPLDEV